MNQPTSRPQVRLPYLSNLRAGLIAYVILGHSALTYSNIDNWYFHQAPIGEPMQTFFAALLGIGNFFVLGLFFFIAGSLTPASAAWLGKGKYFNRRLVQIGVPVACYFVLTPFLTYWGKAVMTGHPGTRHSFIVYVLGFDTGPTWFLLVLLIYTGAYLLLRSVFPVKAAEGGGLSHRMVVGLMVAIAVFTFVVRLRFPLGQDIDLGIHIFQWPEFVVLFATGCIAGERQWSSRPLEPKVRRMCGVYGLIGCAGLGVLAVVSSGGKSAQVLEGGLRWQAFFTAAVEATLAVGVGFWVYGLFELRGNWDGKWARMISPRAFGAYLIHTPLIVSIAIVMHAWPISESLKFWLLAIVGIAGSYALAILSHRTLNLARGAREGRGAVAIGTRPNWQVAAAPILGAPVKAERGL
jgi:hypothetical protein